MILFIHGFASCGKTQKYQTLASYFGDENILAPDLPHSPEQAIALLEDLLASNPIDLLVGSSLGGYYATWLNRQTSYPAVLINPAMAPYVLLDDYLGEHEGCYGSRFELTRDHLQTLRSFYRPTLRDDEAYLVLLQQDDEVLDYQQAATYYAGKDVIIEPGGNHRFENLDQHLPRIAHWRAQHVQTQQSPA